MTLWGVLNKWIFKYLIYNNSIKKPLKAEIKNYIQKNQQKILKDPTQKFFWNREMHNEIISNLKSQIEDKHEKEKSPFQYFTRTEIDTIINSEFKNLYNTSSTLEKVKPSGKYGTLRNKQKFFSYLLKHQNTLNTPKGIKKFIKKYPLEKCHFDVLSHFPNPDSTKDLWITYTLSCLEKGNITTSKPSISDFNQLTYYSKFTKIIDSSPKDIKEKLHKEFRLKNISQDLLNYISPKKIDSKLTSKKNSFVKTILNIESSETKTTLPLKPSKQDLLFQKKYPIIKKSIQPLINDMKKIVGYSVKGSEHELDGSYELSRTVFMYFSPKDIKENKNNLIDSSLNEIKKNVGTEFFELHKKELANACVYECIKTLVSDYHFNSEQIQSLICEGETAKQPLDLEDLDQCQRELTKILMNRDFSSVPKSNSNKRKKGELLSPFEKKGLSMLAKADTLGVSKLNQQEKWDLQEFIKQSMGNMKFNK